MIDSEIQQVEKYYNLIMEYLVTYSMQILGAILILFIGLWIAQKVSNMVAGLMQRHNIDITLTNFVSNVIKVLLIIMFLVIALGKIGISVTPFVAAIGAASLGAGLAMQGMLSNYGAGLAIIATRPFVVGDTIEVKGVSGQVKTIELGHPILINEEKVEI
uniref:mechanosensitive ion channel family protein n=1 Tax=uncultured Pseudoalteromonas sp. TaxID=114053 RepID=UPI0026331DF8